MPDVTGLTAEYAQELISARLRWAGVWSDIVQYASGDLVRVQDTGSLWVAVEDPLLGSEPALTTDPEKWRKTFDSTVDGASNAGGNSLEAASGHLESSGSQTFAYWAHPTHLRGTDQDYIQAKFHHLATDAANNYVGVHFGGSNYNTGFIMGFQFDRIAMFSAGQIGNPGQYYPGGTGTEYAEVAVVGGMPTDGWMRAQRDGNDYHFSYYDTDPAEGGPPALTMSRTLPPSYVSLFGEGIDLVAGVAGSGTTDTFWFDDVVLATPYSGDAPSWELMRL